MEESKSKPFFRDLKETVNVINKVVSETIEASAECPSEYDYSEFNEYYEKKLNDIKQTKDELVKLKKEFDCRLTYFQNYFHDFQDLVLEVEENVNSQEKYLQKYGYKPLEVVPIIESPASKTPPLEERKHKEKSKTPSIYDFIDPGQIYLMRQTNSRDKIEETTNTIHELESSDGTPVLMLNKNSTKCEDLKNLLSAVDGKECIVKTVENLPSTPQFCGYLESSVVAGDSVCDTPYSDVSLNKIARKLNF